MQRRGVETIFFSLLCGFSRGRVSAFVSIHFLPFVLSSFRDRNVILKNASFVRSFVFVFFGFPSFSQPPNRDLDFFCYIMVNSA